MRDWSVARHVQHGAWSPRRLRKDRLTANTVRARMLCTARSKDPTHCTCVLHRRRATTTAERDRAASVNFEASLVGSLRATRSACETAVMHTSRKNQGMNRCRLRPMNLWHHPHFRHSEREGLARPLFGREPGRDQCGADIGCVNMRADSVPANIQDVAVDNPVTGAEQSPHAKSAPLNSQNDIVEGA
jgi:hypothetical protein